MLGTWHMAEVPRLTTSQSQSRRYSVVRSQVCRLWLFVVYCTSRALPEVPCHRPKLPEYYCLLTRNEPRRAFIKRLCMNICAPVPKVPSLLFLLWISHVPFWAWLVSTSPALPTKLACRKPRTRMCTGVLHTPVQRRHFPPAKNVQMHNTRPLQAPLYTFVS